MEASGGTWRYKRLLISANSCKNRRNFILQCIEEKVIPRCIPHHYRNSSHIFPKHALTHLLHIAEDLKQQRYIILNTARTLRSRLHYERRLTTRLEIKINRNTQAANNRQITSLQGKINQLCKNSKWKTIGRADLITNLSSYSPSPTELEALGLGLKFATGANNNNISHLLYKNYRQSDSEFNKGFIQGILSVTSLPSDAETTIPKRYMIALKNLAKNNNIKIMSADKGGGIVIMDLHEYTNKIHALLRDPLTYTPTNLNTIQKETTKFNQAYKRLFTNDDTDKTWTSLIEYHPRIPTLYGLPKTHKANVPMRPITSGIGSAPHKIAKAVAKILTPLLGTISPSHITNSGDLLKKLKNTNITNMSLASLDVQSLYTNVPVDKCLDRLRTHLEKTKPDLPLPIDTIINICTLCTNLNYLTFNNHYYKQTTGLPMGSPLSGALACLFLELLEAGPFQYIFPKNIVYYRYIDDALLIYPNNINLPKLVDRLNMVEPTITFTHECETNNSLPFLDILLHKSEHSLLFSVYRKPTHKHDFINYYSHHHTHIKTSLIIGAYLRALRICSPQFIKQEQIHIKDTFTSLHYPLSFILNAKHKATKIHNRLKKTTSPADPVPSPPKCIFLPTNQTSSSLGTQQGQLGLRVVALTSRTLKQILNSNSCRHISTEEACVYQIPCSKCSRCYVGETSRPIQKRIYEHRRAIITGDTTNALAMHSHHHKHTPDFDSARILKYVHDKRARQILESSIISTHFTIKQRPGFYNIARNLALRITQENRVQINIDNG